MDKRLVSGAVCSLVTVSLLVTEAWAGTTYSLGPQEALLDDDFYNGVAKNGEPAVTKGRSAWFPAAYFTGTNVAFAMLPHESPLTPRLFLVDVGVGLTGTWRQLRDDQGSELNITAALNIMQWTPDGNYLFVEPEDVPTRRVRRVKVSAPGRGSGADVDWEVDTDIPVYDVRGTILQDGSFVMAAVIPAGVIPPTLNNETQLVYIMADSSGNVQNYTIVTDFPAGSFPGDQFLLHPTISPDGTMMAFTHQVRLSTNVLSCPDTRDIYVLPNLDKIVGGTAPAPTALADVTSIRKTVGDPCVDPMNQTEPFGYKTLPLFSQDSSVLTYSEDFNSIMSEADAGQALSQANFDPLVSKPDGTAVDSPNSNGKDFRIAAPGNQALSGGIDGGLRVLFMDNQGSTAPAPFVDLQFRSFISSFIVTTDLTGNDVSNSTVPIDTDGDGTPDDTVTVDDNAIQIDPLAVEDVVVSDVSGTKVTLPPGQVIDFPTGVDQEISISTPAILPGDDQLPPDAPVDAIPIVREFGPDGTTFAPPIEITIVYTDAEVANVDENTFVPYLFNDATQKFDIEVPESDIVLRDPDNNIIIFKVSSFSIYGLAAKGVGVPVRPWARYLIVLIVLVSGVAFVSRRRGPKGAKRGKTGIST